LSSDGLNPATDREKSLADILGEISRTSSLLVRQEIELAKAEVTIKAKRLGAGAAAAGIAGVFAVLALIFFLHGLAWFFADLIGGTGLLQIWLGFLITAGVLLVLGAVCGLLALRYFRRGLPPTPELAIDEAKKTRATIGEVSGG
jgi:VIT1/CCC1 family predicted Fe2+/Mn2+ transporter